MPEFLAVCNAEPNADDPLDPHDLFVAADDPRDLWFGRLRIIVSHGQASETAASVTATGPHCVGWAALTNAENLKRRLHSAGWNTPLAGDLETIRAVWELFGDEGLRLLRGRFAAVAVWPSGEVWACRDQLGLCPLYYRVDGRQVAFSTAIRPLTRVPGFDRRLDETFLAHSIAGRWAVAGRTAWNAVRKIPGGHLLHASGPQVTVTSYWDPVEQAAPADEGFRLREHAAEVGRLLDQAVSRTLGPGRTSVQLSGGFDSTTIAALAASKATKPLLAITWVVEDERFDDLPYAEAAARELGAELLPLTFRPDPALALSSSRWRMDLACRFLDANQNSAAARVRELGAVRMLTGESGDQVLLGRRWAALATLLWDRRFTSAVRYSGGVSSLATKLRQLAGHSPRVHRLRARLGRSHQPGILTRDALEMAGLRDGPTPVGGLTRAGLRREREYWIRMPLAERSRERDFQRGLEVGIDITQPLADVDLVEYVLQVPEPYFVGPPSDRQLHTAALGDRLPEAVRTRATKGEMSEPAMRFAEAHEPDELMRSSRLVEMGLVNRGGALHALADARRRVAAGQSGGYSLWQVLGFVEAEVFMGAIGDAAAPEHEVAEPRNT